MELSKSGFLTQNNFYKILCYVNVNIQIKNENPKFKWSSQKSGFLTQNNFYKILCYVNVNIQINIIKNKNPIHYV